MKLTPALCAVTASVEAALTVPKTCVVSKINEDAVTALLETMVVAAPASVNCPAEQVAELEAGITSLFPTWLITKFPFVAVMLPVVAVNPVAAVTVPPNEGDEGTAKVIVLPDPVVVIWFAVPASVILFALGLIAPPLPPVRVLSAPPSLSNSVQVGVVTPPEVEIEVRT